MRKKILGASWKMHKNTVEEIEFFVDGIKGFSDFQKIETFLLPSFVLIPKLSELLKDTPIHWGAQTMSFVDYGAFTGEVSVIALKEFNSTYVEIGHAERREHFNETNAIVYQKCRLALDYGLVPVVCIGETKNEKDQGIGDDIINEQIEWACKDTDENQVKQMIFAYEPVWAIGQQEGASEAYVQQQHRLIRDKIADLYSQKIANQVRIIYGGSVKFENAEALMKQTDVDGLFVGRFGLEPENFIKIASIVSKV
jgi:triosephosphate isomerase (TIM)